MAKGASVAFSAVEGAASTSQTVATFTDPGGYEADADYSATINWGDNSSSAGTRTKGRESGRHKYAEEGNYTITVTVQHDGAPDATAVTTAASTSDPAIAAKGASATFTALEGATSASQTVATFTDAVGYETDADYSATINWGDNTTS